MKYVLPLIICCLLIACTKNVKQPITKLTIKDFTYNLDSFTTWVYQLKTINYNSFSRTIDSQISYEKHVFDTFFTDNDNRIASRISLFVSLNDTLNYKFKHNYYQVVTTDALEVVSNNTRFLNLSFPLSLEAIWNENAYNNNQQQIMFYTNILKPINILSNKNNVSICVQSNIIKNNFEQRQASRIYVKNVGLAYENKVSKINKQGFFDGIDKTTKLVEAF